MDGKPLYIVCMPWEAAEAAKAILPGSTQDRCHKCARVVAVAPSSRRFDGKRLDTTIVCIPCAMPMILAQENRGEKFKTIPGGKEEFLGHIATTNPNLASAAEEWLDERTTPLEE